MRIILLVSCLVLCVAPVAAQTISVVVDATGEGSTGALDNPSDIARAPDGTLWVTGSSSDNVLRIDPDGTVTEVFDRWPSISRPAGLAVDGQGTLYVASDLFDAVIRRDVNGDVEMLAEDGDPAQGIVLDGPREMAVDGDDNLFVVGRLSDTVLRLDPEGAISQVLGPAGAGAGAPLTQVRDVATDAAGNLYACGVASDNVLMVTPGGVVSQILGPAGDGAGQALDGATALAVADDGTLWVASLFTHTVLRRDPGGAVSVVIDATGAGAGQALFLPNALALAPDGTLYVASLGNDRVFAVAPGGAVSLVAGPAGDGAGHPLNDPVDLAVAPDGRLFIACALSENLFAYDGGVLSHYGDVPGYGSGASSVGDGGLAFELDGRLLVSLWSENEVWRFDAPGSSTVVLDNSGGPDGAYQGPQYVALDGQQRPVIGCANHKVFRIEPDGSTTLLLAADTPGATSGLESVRSMVADAQGRVFVAADGSDNVLRIDLDGSVTEVLGPGGPVAIDRPWGLDVGDDGTLYVTAFGSDNVVALYPHGEVEELFTFLDVYPGDSGGNQAGFFDVSVDPLGRLFVRPGKYGEVVRRDPDGTIAKVFTPTGNEEAGAAQVDDSGALWYVTEYNDDHLWRRSPSGVITELIGPAGDGAGHALVNPGALELGTPGRVSLASRNTDTVFGVDLLPCGAFTLLPAPSPLAGTPPLLTGEGSLCGDEGWLVSLSAARPGAVAALVLGLSELSAPFKGGTLVPFPDAILSVPIDAGGDASLSGTWPTGLPSGAAAWLQAWVPEPPGSAGYHASNGLRLVLD